LLPSLLLFTGNPFFVFQPLYAIIFLNPTIVLFSG
jgi:hypothetical protein